MLWRFICLFAVAGTLWLWPLELSAYVAPITGCHHNGSWYADKSLVPTMEKCLNCQCNKKTLVCRLKVCPEMPMPPPRGCVVVQKKNTCCPYLSCARLEAFYKIPMTRRIIQYLDHYERESIDRVVNDNMLQRRSDDSDTELHVCVKNGTVYKSGSAMSSSNLCSYCYCIGGAEKCVKPKCMLPVDGCKPIFVDSTCCPVRYDCSAKASGKSSQEVRYRKTSNKHFLRMSQRLQRNRGCNAGNQFYSEGQKMKSDPDKPCDICFCIRGQRRCAPKKCSPALKNCIPVVPKGQCCPSSYDCGSQRDYRRSHNSRQFNLFSFLFDKDGNEADGDDETSATEIPEQFVHDREPLKDDNPSVLESNLKPTSEKSIFDTIREGLEFIDGNNDKLLEENIDLLPPNDPLRTVVSLPPPTSTSTEVSFLDLLLGPGDLYNRDPTKMEASIPDEKPTTTGAYNDLSWVDLLIGEEEEDKKKRLDTTYSNKFDYSETTTEQSDYGTTNIDRVSNDFDDFSGDGESLLTDEPENVSIENLQSSSMIESTTMPPTTSTTTKLYRKPPKPFFHPISQKTQQTHILNDWKSKPVTKITDPVTTTTHPSAVAPQKPTEQFHKSNTTVSQSLFSKNDTKLNHTGQVNTQNKKNSILSAFLDGISSALEPKTDNVISGSTTAAPTTTTTLSTTKSTTLKSTTPRTTTKKATQRPITLPTPKPLPQFKPLPTIKSHTRINSKLANLTTNPPMITGKLPDNTTISKPLSHSAQVKLPMKGESKISTPKPTTTSPVPKTSANTTRKPIETTTLPPLVISTNPTILEVDPIDNVGELPPSLPNLEIIPFLPTDAVKTDRNMTQAAPLNGEYYNSAQEISRIDFDPFNEDSIYPAITERYPTFGDEHDDDNKAEYIYKINVEGPVVAPAAVTPASFPAIKYGIVGDVSEVELEVGMPAKKGFSPPTKTEGGFVPKESFIIGADGELHEQVDSFIDITSAQPFSENTTNIIEFTTPDPFKDVIRTEPPPDLTVDRTEEGNKSTTPSTNMSEMPHANETQVDEVMRKQTLSSLLDLLYKYNDKQQTNKNISSTSTSTSTVPPFKLMPDETQKYITTITTANNAETTKIPPTTAQPLSPSPTPSVASVKTRPKNTTTTKRPIASKASNKHRGKPSRPVNVNSTTTPTTTTTTATPSHAESTKSTATLVNGTRTSAKKPIVYKTTTAATISSTTTAAPTTTTSSIKSSTVNPFFMSPFDKLPFMAASYNVRHPNAALGSPAPNAVNIPQNEVQNHYLDLLEYKSSLNKYEGLESIYGNDYTPTPTSTTTPAAPQAQFFHHSQQQHTTATNNLIDPMGMLKLAACNIYGRMYHVGRIILELSSACLECKCTEVGVKCAPLDC